MGFSSLFAQSHFNKVPLKGRSCGFCLLPAFVPMLTCPPPHQWCVKAWCSWMAWILGLPPSPHMWTFSYKLHDASEVKQVIWIHAAEEATWSCLWTLQSATHVVAVPAPSHCEVQPQPAARGNTLKTRELHCSNFACMEYSEILVNEYLAAFFIRRSLLSVTWASSCLMLCFPLKK